MLTYFINFISSFFFVFDCCCCFMDLWREYMCLFSVFNVHNPKKIHFYFLMLKTTRALHISSFCRVGVFWLADKTFWVIWLAQILLLVSPCSGYVNDSRVFGGFSFFSYILRNYWSDNFGRLSPTMTFKMRVHIRELCLNCLIEQRSIFRDKIKNYLQLKRSKS